MIEFVALSLNALAVLVPAVILAVIFAADRRELAEQETLAGIEAQTDITRVISQAEWFTWDSANRRR